ncbi:MAG: PD-(D/E)XK nuclease family protein [Armatimonadota bacterium]|nr:exodeoxyribonuclease V subunit gamma [bacterium]
MAVRIISGPAHSGKTNYALDRICQLDPLDWTSKVRYVVPTIDSARAVESCVLEKIGLSGILGNVVCTFYSFADEFISRLGLSGRLISDIQKGLMLESLVQGMELSYFAKSATYPGFIEALDEIIGELKTSLVTPEELTDALSKCGSELSSTSVNKVAELAALYTRYQKDILEHNNLHDREGLMWRALEIAKGPSIPTELELVIFDGFNDLNGVQREFLSIIASRVPEVIVTLPFEPNRPEVFSAVEDTHKFLLELGASEIRLQRKKANESALARLESSIFRSTSDPSQPNDSVIILEGGDPTIEIELVAEEIHKLVWHGDCAFGDIAITCRDIGSYRRRICRIFADYHIPVSQSNQPLTETTVARLLVTGINLVRNSWQRDDVLRILKSEMVTADLAAACKVEVDAKQAGTTSGRENWLRQWSNGDSTLEFRKTVLQPFADFEDSLQNANSTEETVKAVSALLDSFSWRISDDQCLAQDSAADKALRGILDDLIGATRLIDIDINSSRLLGLLEGAVTRSEYQIPAQVKNSVQLISVNAINGRHFMTVFVVGLLEKAFPRQIREESFLRDRERFVLCKHLGHDLRMRLPQQNTERLLFHSAIAATDDKLYLCYPLSDETAKDSLPSFYVEEAAKLFADPLTRVRRDVSSVVPDIADACSEASLERAVVHSLSQSANASDVASAIYNGLPASRRMILGRVFRDCQESDAFLSDPRLLVYLLETERVYRCTELEAYASCPFMHFCQSTLSLEPIREEVGALDFGGILHETLRRLFIQLRSEYGDGLRVRELDAESTVQAALAILDDEFARSSRLSQLPAHESDLQLHNLRAYIRRYVTAEIKKGWDGFVPKHFELEFGFCARDDRPRDPMSTDQPLVITSDDGFRFSVGGRMDRVDISSSGALVIDYKLGTSTKITKFEDGITLQAMVYALALREVFGLVPAGTEYRPIKTWAPEGYYTDSTGITKRNRVFSDAEFADKLRKCEQLVTELAQDIRSGRICIEPKECKDYCSFGGVCRIDSYKLLMQKEAAQAGNDSVSEEVEP